MTISEGGGGFDSGGRSDGVGRMNADIREFERRVAAVLVRFARQNGVRFENAAVERFAAQLGRLVDERGLPPPLREGERGAPGELEKSEVRELTAWALEGVRASEDFADAAKQIVKACFYPEFRVCRDSYRERSGKGVCKRQVLEKARGRVSGAHCVDCPYWTDVSPERHTELLRAGWCGDPAELGENRAVFLPEDFRAVRRWVREAARQRAG
jgi:hypothetical protein